MLNSVSEQFAEFFIFLRWQENTRAQHPKLLILKTVKEDVGTRIRLPLKHSPNVCQLWVSCPSCPVWRKKRAWKRQEFEAGDAGGCGSFSSGAVHDI